MSAFEAAPRASSVAPVFTASLHIPTQAMRRLSGRARFGEADRAFDDIDLHCVLRAERTIEDLPRERILEIRLYRPFQRTRAIDRIETSLGDMRQSGIGDGQPDLQFPQTLFEKSIWILAIDRIFFSSSG